VISHSCACLALTSLIAAPGGRVSVERKFGHLTASFDAFGTTRHEIGCTGRRRCY
jgi:hypothetical protein